MVGGWLDVGCRSTDERAAVEERISQNGVLSVNATPLPPLPTAGHPRTAFPPLVPFLSRSGQLADGILRVSMAHLIATGRNNENLASIPQGTHTIISHARQAVPHNLGRKHPMPAKI